VEDDLSGGKAFGRCGGNDENFPGGIKPVGAWRALGGCEAKNFLV
jgi:hypothetical protein